MKARRRKAIALMSGGLDSQLAAKIVMDQGVETVGLHLLSPFGCRTEIGNAAKSIGVPLIVREKGAAFLELIKNPRYGYGRNMNPCIDCRIFMFHIAAKVMQEEGADFVVTGEVLGQRPMSQRRAAMELIDHKSGLSGLILRPLSAQELPATVPEKESWIERESLLAITGRGRKQQLELANRWHLKGYGSPGGGCLLTERMFSPKLKDFFQHEESNLTPEVRLAQSELLRIGRHFRLSDSTKVIVSRNKAENTELSERWKKAEGVFFFPDNFDGPNAIAVGPVNNAERQLVGEMIARYGKAKDLLEKRIKFDSTAGPGEFTVMEPVSEETLNAMRI